MTPPQKLAADMGLLCKYSCTCLRCEILIASMTKAYAEGRRVGLREQERAVEHVGVRMESCPGCAPTS